MASSEIYVSTDIETDGPAPGINSMLSIGSAAFLPDGSCADSFSANLVTLPGATPDSDTAKWWSSHPDAFAACRANAREPIDVMVDYHAWLTALPGKPIFVGYPASFDFMFVHWYLIRFVGNNPFGHSAIDVRSYAMALRGSSYANSSRRHLPAAWLGDSRNSHVALDDAMEQGQLFCNMLRYRSALEGPLDIER